jgi:hypothetical protein
VSDKLTIADFVLASLISNILKNDISPFSAAFGPTLLEYPHFGAYSKRIISELNPVITARGKKFF